MKPPLLFHVQHFFGMGHLIRAAALAEALSECFAVTLVSGGPTPVGLSLPRKVDLLPLAPLGMDADKQLVSLEPGRSVAEAVAHRRRVLLDAYDRLRPAVVLIELFPFGRKKLADELIPLLERARDDRRRPVIASSVRDILVTGRHDQRRHDARAADIADRFFDHVLVHGDRRFADFSDSFRPPGPFVTPIIHTGFIARPGVSSAEASEVRPGSIVVSAGGGWVGDALMRAAIEAQPLLWEEHGVPMTLISGPLADRADHRASLDAASARPGLTVLRSVPQLLPVLRGAEVSISQCGYNTTIDVLKANVPAVVVPFGDAQENEQQRRAARLAELGLATAVEPEAADGPTLARAASALLGSRPPAPAWATDGARRSTEILAGCVVRALVS